MTKKTLNDINKLLAHMRAHSPYFKDVYKNCPSQLNSLADFQKLPFISKKMLAETNLKNRLCVDMKEVREVHYSSGTTSSPIIAAYTEIDLKKSRENLSKTWRMQGAKYPGTRFAMLASYGLFSAGLINHYAIQYAGSTVIPMGSAKLEKVISVSRELKPEIGVAVSSFYLFFLEQLRGLGIDPREMGFKKLIAGGEYMSEEQRAYVENKFDVKLLFQYGLAEIDTGIAGECDCQNGMHLLDDYVYGEIIDPKSGQVLEPGEEGELVLSHLRREATPLLRYRTGDITKILKEKCSCGRKNLRLAPIKRRVGQSFSYKGMNIDKEEFEAIISRMAAMNFFHPHVWQLRLHTDGAKQKIEFKVRPTSESTDGLEKLSAEIKKQTGINIEVSIFSDEEYKNISEGKFNKLSIIQHKELL